MTVNRLPSEWKFQGGIRPQPAAQPAVPSSYSHHGEDAALGCLFMALLFFAFTVGFFMGRAGP